MGDKKTMEQDWDERAKKDAMHYIATRGTSWNEAEFFEKGTLEVHLCRDFFLAQGFDPTGKHMLDIGCGIGRLDRGFAEMFAGVWGVDVSGEMIVQATKLNREFGNVRFVQGNGEDLRQFPNEFFDFVYSGRTFQHIPEKRIIVNYLQEMYRVLRPNGLFKIQLRKPWGGFAFALDIIPVPRVVFPYIPAFLWLIYERLALRGDRNKLYRGKTWRGCGIYEKNAKWLLKRVCFNDIQIVDDIDGVTYWCYGRKL